MSVVLIYFLYFCTPFAINNNNNRHFFSHSAGQLALASTSRIMSVQSFTARMPLLMETSAFRL